MFNNSKIALLIVIITLLVFTGLSIKFFSVGLFSTLEDGKYKWEKVEATIENIVLESTPNPNMPDGVFTNDICKISYSYSLKNINYKNESFGLKRDIDYTSAFHRELFEKLKNANKFMIYINPEKPKQASIIKYDFPNRKIGSGIVTLSFVIFLSFLLYQNFKYPPNYISNQIELK